MVLYLNTDEVQRLDESRRVQVYSKRTAQKCDDIVRPSLKSEVVYVRILN